MTISSQPAASRVREWLSVRIVKGGHARTRTMNAGRYEVLNPARTVVVLGLIDRDGFPAAEGDRAPIARSAADVDWDDLLQEAMTRAIVGTRRAPDGVTMVGFLAGVMRSCGASTGSARAVSPCHADVADRRDALTRTTSTRRCSRSDPSGVERAQELEADPRVVRETILSRSNIAGIGKGLLAEQIRSAVRLSKRGYDSARKRIRRTLLREELTHASTRRSRLRQWLCSIGSWRDWRASSSTYPMKSSSKRRRVSV